MIIYYSADPKERRTNFYVNESQKTHTYTQSSYNAFPVVPCRQCFLYLIIKWQSGNNSFKNNLHSIGTQLLVRHNFNPITIQIKSYTRFNILNRGLW